ncbi:MAG: carboxyl-terminal protease, partial [Dolichospermum sp.]
MELKLGFIHKPVGRLGCLLLLLLALVFTGYIPPASALTPEQKLVYEVWRIVNRSYLDGTFNDQNWL